MHRLSMISAGMACMLLLGGCQSISKWSGARSSTPNESIATEKTVRTRRNLALTLRLDPFPIKLTETRRVEAVIQLENRSSRFIQLEFSTSQRFDLLIKDAAGTAVVQWSEDQSFESVPSCIGINPGERLEYRAGFSSRDLQPGKRYTATAFFPNRKDLRVELPFVPR